ncbi:MAG TPA: hypothetical protein VIL86_06480 [Tepidisphaeraceae bacterium]|jgi:hypothetical protein
MPVAAGQCSHRRLFLWLLFFLVCLIGSIHRLRVGDQFTLAYRNWVAQRDDYQRRGAVAIRGLYDLARWPRDVIESAINGERAFKLATDEDGEEFVNYIEPVTGNHYKLVFRGSSCSVVGSVAPPAFAVAAPSISAVWIAGEVFRRLLVSCGLFFWIAVMVLAMIWRRHQRLIVELGLALAIAWLVAGVLQRVGAVSDGVRIDWPRLYYHSYDDGVNAGIAVVASLLFGWRAWTRREAPRLLNCPGCNYSLKRNASGTCPECGRPISSESVQLLRAIDSAADALEKL